MSKLYLCISQKQVHQLLTNAPVDSHDATEDPVLGWQVGSANSRTPWVIVRVEDATTPRWATPVATICGLGERHLFEIEAYVMPDDQANI